MMATRFVVKLPNGKTLAARDEQAARLYADAWDAATMGVGVDEWRHARTAGALLKVSAGSVLAASRQGGRGIGDVREANITPHVHTFQLDKNGVGMTNEVFGHKHQVSGGKVWESHGHTHSLKDTHSLKGDGAA